MNDYMKRGNSFYLEFNLSDGNDSVIEIDTIDKVVFTIGNLTKKYGFEDNDDDISIDANGVFKVWLSQEDTLSFEEDYINVEVRIKYTNGIVDGSNIEHIYIKDCLNTEVL